MGELGLGILSAIVFLPLLGAVVVLFLHEERRQTIYGWALAVTLVEFALSLVLAARFRLGEAAFQFVEEFRWVPSLGIRYAVGVDGVSLFFVCLTAFLAPLAVLAAWGRVQERVKGFTFWLLLLETGILGAFTALDLVVFYIFWEAMLVPMYFLIGAWGGERRWYATLKFFLYTMAGSALMLVGILALGAYHFFYKGGWSFDLRAMGDLGLPVQAQLWLFGVFALAFLVKVPVFPFHTWLPDAYEQAPNPVMPLLAGVLGKVGVYGFLRFCLPLFPAATDAYRPWVSALAVVGIVYGSLAALGQRDLKRLVAYSSVAHLSLIVLGLFALTRQGVQGAVIQSVSHGIYIAALFLLVAMLEERKGTRFLEAFGGLWKAMPVLGFFLLVSVLAAVGLPGLNGFVGEFTLLVGVFLSNRALAALAALGMIFGAWYMLWAFQQVMQGEARGADAASLPDVRGREWAMLVPLVVVMLLIGLLPNLLFSRMDASVERLLQHARPGPVIMLER
ncbi:MAG: complex I subunit 4 family protein [Anaerolineae bacterium]